jgi:predicted Zn-dependent peptidase
LTCTLRPGIDLNRLEAVIEEELAKIKEEGTAEKEYQKALNMIRSNFYFGLQTNSGRANDLGSTEVLYGSYEKLFTLMDNYISVKREKVQETAKKYFTENNKSEKIMLKNGLPLYYLKNADFPLTSFRMFLRGAGSVFEPDALEGIGFVLTRPRLPLIFGLSFIIWVLITNTNALSELSLRGTK